MESLSCGCPGPVDAAGPFELYASKNVLWVKKKFLLTSGSANVYTARFEFSPDWQGLITKAVFRGSGTTKTVLLDGGECTIPWEVLTSHGQPLMAGVFGTLDETALPTTWASLGTILEGVPGDAEGASPPTPDLWQQELDRKGDALAYDGLSLSLKSGDKTLSSVEIAGGGGGPGTQGPPGKSAYEIAVDNGFVGTEQEWLTSLEGPQGEIGPPGPQGPKGETGEQGPAGADGAPGPKGDKGDTGAQGPAGPTGADGVTFTPSVSEDGVLSWTNDGGLPNPGPVNIKGPPGEGGGAGGVPIGTIAIWSGSESDIPTGWALCDGQNGRPDLRDRFVLGASSSNPVGSTGGYKEVRLTTNQMPRHIHGQQLPPDANSTNGGSLGKPWRCRWDGTSGVTVDYAILTGNTKAVKVSATSTSVSTEVSGNGDSHPNMPPYYALCYIVKIAPDETDGVTMEQVNEAINTAINGAIEGAY